ncbi:MAG: type I methionyl aminopeptidase [Clostridia bacterium]|nr:type I methionyl aminopeptidase [Clostridia bacterium]MDE7216190.1 type I methionyl aminopeptidase [Clostridia bacterium]MDE7336833.1 type I methionyl aminopeptidase [Clostridia bacterium]
MITIKTPAEIELMRKANQIVRDTLDLLQDSIKEGMTTAQLNKIAHDHIVKCDAKPSFLGYGGFPASICTSVNEQVVHGIPSDKVVIKEGDIVSVDCGSIYKGYNGDAARTFEIGKVSQEKHKLVEVTKQSFFEGVKILKEGVRLGDLGYAIQSYAESFGYGVVRDLVGHGIGREMHEDPQVPNYGKQGHGMRLKKNMTIAIEPMINMGTHKVYMLDDGWTIVTMDNMPSAHYENTVLITEEGVEILSL